MPPVITRRQEVLVASPLEGLSVLDISEGIAGPFCAKLLADLGARVCKVEAPAGATILEIAHNNDIDIEGACEGMLACSTCHVIVDPEWYGKLSPPEEDEEDMLDLAFGLTRTSRLGCQIVVTEALDGLTVRLPDETHNMLLI